MKHTYPDTPGYKDDRDYLDCVIGDMKTEYATFEDHYKELSEFLEPRRGRFIADNVNKGDKRHKSIINNHATIQLSRAESGMLAGAMSPSRPWFGFGLLGSEEVKTADGKAWLSDFRKLVLRVLNATNTYNQSPIMLGELLQFATGFMTYENDFDNVIRFSTHTVGSYYLRQNGKHQVDGAGRESMMTVREIVTKFGLSNVSYAVKNAWDNSNYNSRYKVCYLTEPNRGADAEGAKVSSRYLPYRSVWWEPGCKERDSYLRTSGFKQFPGFAPRWRVTDGDLYGTSCPGMLALGDVKQLQSLELEAAKALKKKVSPPLQGPATYQNRPVNNLPGGYSVNAGKDSKIEPVYVPITNGQDIAYDIQRTEQRITAAFFGDLFRAISEMRGVQPMNELQLSQIDAERLLHLGPVLEQIHGEWLSRMVTIVAQRCLEVGLMRPAPPELEGRELDIEFISALAMAQRAVATGSIERVFGFAAQLTEQGWDMRAKLDADEALDQYAGLVGAPPRVLVPSQDADKQREAEQKQAQQAEQMAMANQAANAAKMASEAKMDGDSVLSRAAGGGNA